jgi:valyl-tRNA synthetase
MRKAILLSLIFVFVASVFATAQVRESQRKMNQGTNNAMVLNLPDVEEKFIKKLWEDYMDDFYDVKTKRVRKAKEYLSDNAEIAAIGGNTPIDVYAYFEGDKEDVELTVWFDLGGAYLSSTDHPDRYKEAEKMLMRFALEVAKESTKLELEDQEDMLKDLEKDLAKLKKDNDRYHKTIENAKKKIAEAEDDIEQNEKDQVSMQAKIEEQLKAVEAVRKKLNDL